MSTSELSLKRLTLAGLCETDDPDRHAAELRAKANRIALRVATRSLAKKFAALSDGTRLTILGLLRDRPRCVCEIVTALQLSQPNVSHHLSVLENAGLVASNRQGKWIFYQLTKDPETSVLLNGLF